MNMYIYIYICIYGNNIYIYVCVCSCAYAFISKCVHITYAYTNVLNILVHSTHILPEHP